MVETVPFSRARASDRQEHVVTPAVRSRVESTPSADRSAPRGRRPATARLGRLCRSRRQLHRMVPRCCEFYLTDLPQQGCNLASQLTKFAAMTPEFRVRRSKCVRKCVLPPAHQTVLRVSQNVAICPESAVTRIRGAFRRRKWGMQRIKRPLLYQLSYAPKSTWETKTNDDFVRFQAEPPTRPHGAETTIRRQV